ncbi:hypothetical protein, partial [Heyndrickxia ginsengihumi]|uniref:hypothetical protein n=1 Tax=Heyndrickxia ginsengihumi TaxID=363870 RepID=UPI001969D8F6
TATYFSFSVNRFFIIKHPDYYFQIVSNNRGAVQHCGVSPMPILPQESTYISGADLCNVRL